MKIKKKELRRGQAQLPINYPRPLRSPGSEEMVAVEALCKQLGHNEVSIRRPVLEQVPTYIRKLMAPMAEMEAAYEGRTTAIGSHTTSTSTSTTSSSSSSTGRSAKKSKTRPVAEPPAAATRDAAQEDVGSGSGSEIESVTAYFAAHPNSPNPYFYHNLTEGLKVYREKVAKEHRSAQQRESMKKLKQRRLDEHRRRAQAGRYGAAAEHDEQDTSGDSDAEEVGSAGQNAHRAHYHHWIQSWADLELVLLKLSRGLFFCLWHSDKPLEQLACADLISGFIAVPPTPRGQVLMASCLLRVLSREWPTIDHYRMDKYLALARRLLQQVFQIMKRSSIADSSTEAPQPPSPEKAEKNAAGRKRSRAEAEGSVELKKCTTAAGSSASDAAMAFTARGIAEALLVQHFGHHPLVQRVAREVLFLFQVHLIPNTTSVGLIMHICDVSFDELEKAFNADCPAPLFAVAAAGIPLYAMSQGNYVEKRVLDYFFPPLAAGVLSSRRAAQLVASLTQQQQDALRRKGSRGGAPPPAKRLSVEEIEAIAQSRANADTRLILELLLHACQSYAVCRGTVRVVRVMFSEAELVLRQALDPEAYMPLSRTAQRRRIEKEIEEVNETRRRVRDERAGVKEAKKTVKRKELMEKVKERKAALLRQLGETEEPISSEEDADKEEATGKKKRTQKKAVKKKGKNLADTAPEGAEESRPTGKKKGAVTLDTKSLRKAILEEEAAEKKGGKKVKITRDSKRKKHYKLTRKDLFGEEDT
eukprot:gene6977-4941_t